jgi:N-acetylglucosaminyldiphosphoundecaprenol N-acetyl-beta-D-mannosaminyltransferase
MRTIVDEPCMAAESSGLLQSCASLSGIPLHTPTGPELEGALHRSFFLERLCCISTLRFRDVWRARKDVTFRGILRRMDLLVPEGCVVTLASRLSMNGLPGNRVRTDLIRPVLTVARDAMRRVFFLGGRGSDPFDWGRRACQRYPGLIIAGAHAPGIDFRDAAGGRRLADRLNASGADVVIALPSTNRGEEFPFRYGRRLEANLYLDLRHGARPVIARRQSRTVRRPLGYPEPRRVVLLSN